MAIESAIPPAWLRVRFPRTTAPGSLRFYSFVLVTGVLLLRPGDMFPRLNTMPVYTATLALGVLCAGRALLNQLDPRSLANHPITICVIGVFATGILSNAVHGDFDSVQATFSDCLSYLLFYLLLVGALDSVRRLQQYLVWVLLFILLVCGVGLLQYYGLVDLQAAPYAERQDDQLDPNTGEAIVLRRLCGPGTFANPNDLARIIIVGGVLCLYCADDRRRGLRRHLWWLPMGMLGYALHLTYSRGGFLGVMSAMATLLVLRLGRWKSFLLAIVLLPPLLYVLRGRIINIDTADGTGQQRIQLWRDAFAEMKSSPVFGLGLNQFAQTGGLLAHNSFMQAYVETGLLGGIFFTGAFYLSAAAPIQLAAYSLEMADPEMRRVRPYLIAIIVGSAVGMLSSTRNLRADTYMLPGMVAAYLSIIAPHVPGGVPQMDRRLAVRLAGIGALILVGMNIYVRVAAQ